MANGEVHFNDTLVVGVLVAPLAWGITGDARTVLAAAGGTLFAIFFTPDDDLPGRTYAANLAHRLVPGSDKLLMAIKAPLLGVHRKHRGASHWPFVGTAARMLNVAAVAVLVRYLFGSVALRSDLALMAPWLWWFYLAAAVADCVHIYRDRQGGKEDGREEGDQLGDGRHHHVGHLPVSEQGGRHAQEHVDRFPSGRFVRPD